MVSEKSKVYQAVAYYRLSKDDGDKGESNSIINQRKLIHEFVSASDDITLAGEKQDDGYTGTNFDRPGFKELLLMLEEGKADCVIVKDLSRLGRDYIETGKYIERIFPAMGIRFIAVNDCIDSGKKNQADEIVIPFKNLINDSYCRELSNKLRRQFRVQRAKGEFIGSFAAFGYLKSPEDRHRLVVDETAADVVRLIFARRIAGYSCQKIADYLNQFGFLSPSEYKKSIGLNYRSGFKEKTQSAWGAATIRRILTNRIYVGDLEQGKRSTPNYKVKKMQEKERGEWVIVQGAHEAIVSNEVFETVARLAERDARTSPKQDKVYPLSGILFCGDCHASMIRRVVKRGRKEFCYYVCSANKKKQGCSSHSMAADVLHDKILKAVQLQVALVVETEEFLQRIGNSEILNRKVHRLEKLIVQKTKELESQQDFRMKLYEHMTEGIITKEEFSAMRQSYTAKITKTQEAVKVLEQELEDSLRDSSLDCSWMQLFKKNRNVTELDRELVVTLVNRIEVFEDKRVEVSFNFCDELAQIQGYLKTAGKEHDFSAEAV